MQKYTTKSHQISNHVTNYMAEKMFSFAVEYQCYFVKSFLTSCIGKICVSKKNRDYFHHFGRKSDVLFVLVCFVFNAFQRRR